MASITTFTRLEPRARIDNMAPFLEGRIYDPLWLLGRQWQVREFVGADAGWPVCAELQVLSIPLAAYQSGTAPPTTCGQFPLDALAGPEPRGEMMQGGPKLYSSLFECAEAGAQLMDLLVAYGCSAAAIGALITNNPLPPPAPGAADAQGMSYLTVLSRRLPDAEVVEPLLREAVANGAVPTALGIPPSDNAAFLKAATDWIAWLDALVLRAPGNGDAWVDASLDHQFTVRAGQPLATPLGFAASAWDGERMDWYDLDVDPKVTDPNPPAPALPGVNPMTGIVAVKGPPGPLSYPGMPPPRLWQFDEGHVNFAQITAAKDDLARMLVVEFACVYNNEYYIWPLRLPVGSLNIVQTLNVTDTFGNSTLIPPAGTAVPPGGAAPPLVTAVGQWCLFRSTVPDQDQASALNGLLLLSALTDERRSAPLEDVLFMRDEAAELGWAIERTVEGADGRPLDRHSATVAEASQSPSPASSGSEDTPLTYRLASIVPAWWFPLADDQTGKAMFDRLKFDGNSPSGRILRPDLTTLLIRQEEVPREGAEVLRSYHAVRGVDGAVLVWSGRTKRTGRGEGASGLRYDQASD
jgi:hypothetical protein